MVAFFSCVKAQPHSPFVVLVADFQQLQPVESGGLCQQFCQRVQQCPIDTVYRSKDEEHLLFCNRIRVEQPTRELQEECFADRHWKERDLHVCVRTGMRLAKEAQEPFAWLTCTNRGASEVCKAALDLEGVADEEIASGYYCDPTSKSDLGIVFKKGTIYRLTRNMDKA